MSDTRMLGPDRPAINYAERGALYLEIDVHGPEQDPIPAISVVRFTTPFRRYVRSSPSFMMRMVASRYPVFMIEFVAGAKENALIWGARGRPTLRFLRTRRPTWDGASGAITESW
jgi:hypothetical protein